MTARDHAAEKFSKVLMVLNALRPTSDLISHAATLFARSKEMLDLILVAGALAAFALSIAYAYACDRL